MDVPQDFFVVGVGASAGGLEAAQKFFRHLSHGSHAAFVVVQHLSPDFKSLMDELLVKHTDLNIVKIEEPTPIKPGHIYLMTPQQNVVVADNELRPVAHEKNGKINLPIDLFFHSLGKEKQDCAMGIILSGTGTDGSRGIRTIHEQGGIVMVQNPDEAKFDGMPRTAIASGVADYTLDVEQLAAEINRLVDGDNAPRTPDRPEKLLTTEEDYLNELLGMIFSSTKIDFSLYRPETILRRLTKRLFIVGQPDMEAYYHYVQQHPSEVEILAKEFLIGVSQFFRDTGVWDDVASEVIPKITTGKKNHEIIRVWVSGCSTGEEAYTLGILLNEALRQMRRPVSLKIFATDVDPRAVAYAGDGRYGEDIVNTVPTAYLSKYFDHLDDGYRVKKEFRERFVFAVHNFISDPPFINMDLVSCRNALIYIRPKVQQKVLEGFRFSLKEGGFLVLGKSENLGEMNEAFSTVIFRSKIFRASPNYQPPTRKSQATPHRRARSSQDPPSNPTPTAHYAVQDIYTELLAEQHAPDSVFVNPQLDVLYIHGHANRYLRLPRRQVRLHLEQMLDPEFITLFKSGIDRALRHDTPTVYEDVVLQPNERLSLRFRKLLSPGTDDPLVLIEFVGPQEDTEADVAKLSPDAAVQDRIQQLEQQLQSKEHDLQELQEQLETSSEELQASNEELLSSNEELQSSNEELQSLNEELYTVNTELQEKVDELVTTNNDIDNLLKSTQIATLFLDRDLRIRMFTPAISEIIPISNHDGGRALDHFSVNLQEVDLLDYARQVLDQGQPVEREVTTRDRKRFLLRVFPYQKSDTTTDGLVVTFVDLTEIKRARQAVRDAKNYAESIVNSVKDPLVVLNETLEVVSANPAFYRTFAVTPDKTVDQPVYELGDGQWNIPELRRLLEQIIPNDTIVTDYTVRREFLTLGYRAMQLNAVRVQRDSELPSLILLSIRDVTNKEATEQQVRDTAERLDLVLQSSQTGIWEWNLTTNRVRTNDRWKTIFAIPDEDVDVQRVLNRIHPDDLERVNEAIARATEDDQFYNEDFRVVDEQGQVRYVNGQGSVIRDERGQPTKMLGTNVDIGEKKRNELALQATNRRLKVVNEYLDNFVFMAAHDLRSPVANLKSLIELWRSGYDSKVVIEKVQRSVYRLDDTLDGLIRILDTQQYHEGQVRQLKFATLYDKLVAELEPTVRSTQATLRTNFEAPTISYIEPYLESMMRNLLSNALKYRSPDRPLEIALSTQRDNGHVVLRVQDNGVGMDLERGHEKLFKAFERLTMEGEGQGIGMHLVKNMVEKNEGFVKVESELGEGSTFILYLKPYE